MNRVKEMKDLLDEYPYCDNRDIDRDLLQWAVEEIERSREALEFIQQWATFDNIDSITEGEALLSKIRSRAYQALREAGND